MQLVLRFMDNIRYAEIIILLTLCVIAITALVGIIFVLKRALSHRSHLYLEVKHGNQAIHLCVMQLENSMRFYSITLPSVPITLNIKHYGMIALLKLGTEQLRVKNTLTNIRMHVPRTLYLTPWKELILSQIIASGDFSIQVLLIHSHEINYLSNTDRVI